MFGLGPTEMLIILVIVLLIFGAKRLPEIGKGIGGAIREFKNVKKELSPNGNNQEGQVKETEKSEQDNPKTLEGRAMDKVLEQVPGVKKAMDVKKKADMIKKIIK
jgi:sec-independent protein translocase protein TatA